ncbi:MAG: type IV secretory system conjugative DNA transfer family protein [Rhizomicrobium sp.]
MLNQIGRHLTERLEVTLARVATQASYDAGRVSGAGRLDFFETALAFMAGYGIRAYLIAQSLNQISKAYGENNAILDNCHVRIAFSSNDERTAKRISDALGTATELRAQKNYAGHRLSPWLSHVMVSRQETARPLLTPGEVMQLPPNDELVLISSLAPIEPRSFGTTKTAISRRVCSPPPHWPTTPTVIDRTPAPTIGADRCADRTRLWPRSSTPTRAQQTTKAEFSTNGIRDFRNRWSGQRPTALNSQARWTPRTTRLATHPR